MYLGLKLVVSASFLVGISSFNLDLFHPIIYQSNQPGDYFGYSLALHPGSPANNDYPWMMVGAPKSNNSVLRSIRRDSGLVYKCSIMGPCNRLKLEPPSSKKYTNVWDGAMVGSTMDMTHERFVVCSPNWKTKLNNDNAYLHLYGICYSGQSKDADNFDYFIPLSDGSRNNDLEPINNQHFPKYIWGQAGFSVTMQSSATGKHEMLIGAPSVGNWDGSTVTYRDDSDWSEGRSRRRRSPIAHAFTQGPLIPNLNEDKRFKDYSFLGYSVALGKFFSRSELVIAAGAPAADLTGSVFVYKITYNRWQRLFPMVIDILDGSQPGEYFGAAIASGDINNDGIDDLVVGASQFSNLPYSQNDGRVLVYFGSLRGRLETAPFNHEIKGQARNGRLGSTIACIGDIDLDGYDDFAIAAPYEGSGVVYIYMGSAQGLHLSQVVAGSQFNPQMSGFGYGISRGQDIDGNGYKDIAIGVYRSGHAVVLRAKPVVTLTAKISFLGEKLKDDSKELNAEICIMYSGQSPPKKIKVIMVLSMDPGNYRIYRALNPSTSITQETLEVPLQGDCRMIKFLLQGDIRNVFTPIQVIANFSLAPEDTARAAPIFISGDNRVSGQDKFCRNCPLLRGSTVTTKAEMGFYLACRIENKCVAELKLQAQFLDSYSSLVPIDRYVVKDVNSAVLQLIVDNQGDPAYNTKVTIKLPSSPVTIPSGCKDSANGTVECDVGNPLKSKTQRILLLELDLQTSVMDDSALSVGIQATTNTVVLNQQALTTNLLLPLAYQADVTVYGHPQQEDYRFELESGNKEAKSKVSPVLVYKMEKAGKSPLQEVALKVKIPVSAGSTKFLHLSPPEFYSGSILLSCQPNEFVQQLTTTAPPVTPPPGSDGSIAVLNPDLDLGIGASSASASSSDFGSSSSASAASSSTNVRSKRDTMSEAGYDEFKFPINRTLFINCSNNEWKCTELICSGPLLTDKRPAELKLQLNLDMALLEKELGANDIVIFATTAKVEIVNPKSVEQPAVQSPDVAHISAVLLRSAQAGKVETWVIALSVIGGILLLMLLVTGLVKAGFFQRKTRDELLLQKRQTQMAAAGAVMSNGGLDGEDNTVYDDNKPTK
ncbi:integrin alpha-9-like [Neocloeon triangulifer]|uniref:integrin alpha-9-like n=1 Tax=Neocloeon triangulifer TaxID=2078957 RepID=UPI00286F82BD|nr:integrin alpha-9-like [Neocloeon triangulifer]